MSNPKEELTKTRAALEYIRAAMVADTLAFVPSRALGRETLNIALEMAGYPPVEDRQIQIIGQAR